MPEAKAAPAVKAPAQKIITELKVSAHLMTLDTGLFCIVQAPARAADAVTGLPGVRVSLPPGTGSRPDAVTISTFRPDGWLVGAGDAALVRVIGGPAHILVTIYQSPLVSDGAPSLQVMRLLDPAQVAAAGAARAPVAAAPAAAAAAPARGGAAAPTVMEMVAHIQERGDVGAMLGDWLGERGSKRWIEGFGLAPTKLVEPKDIEYQAVLGRGWLSPWVEGGQFCGSRGMALPILGLRVRLRGAAAEQYELSYSASFTDGAAVGPVGDGEPCEAESLAPIEAFQVVVRARGAADQPADAEGEAAPATEAATLAAATARAPAAKPKAPAGRKPPGPAGRR
jgi:hypothetical protein